MKKIILVAIVMAFSFSSHGQTDYKMWESVYIKPILSKIDLFEKAIGVHNKKFHSKDPYRASVWSVSTGKYGGWYVNVMGPTTFTHLDSRPNDDAHNKDWNGVMTFVQDISATEYFRINDDLSYSPEKSDPFGKEIWRIYSIKNGQDGRFRELTKKIVEVYKANNLPRYRTFFEGVQNGSNGRDFYTGIGFSKWADLDQNLEFRKMFTALHGENSWINFIRDMDDIVTETQVELCEFLPALSADRN